VGECIRPLERYPHLSVHPSSDPRRLPFADQEFDAVLSCGVLEHVETQTPALRRFAAC
jgi:ubiquinone/menaquinone biosynthesis C-methylase UbiE